jgi:hypothetical protein
MLREPHRAAPTVRAYPAPRVHALSPLQRRWGLGTGVQQGSGEAGKWHTLERSFVSTSYAGRQSSVIGHGELRKVLRLCRYGEGERSIVR